MKVIIKAIGLLFDISEWWVGATEDDDRFASWRHAVWRRKDAHIELRN
jgi:hypothetical protein